MSSSIENPATSNQHQAIGIDLGGTNIKAALVDTQSAKTLATLSKPTRDGEFEGDTPHFALTVREIVHEFEVCHCLGARRTERSAPA